MLGTLDVDFSEHLILQQPTANYFVAELFETNEIVGRCMQIISTRIFCLRKKEH